MDSRWVMAPTDSRRYSHWSIASDGAKTLFLCFPFISIGAGVMPAEEKSYMDRAEGRYTTATELDGNSFLILRRDSSNIIREKSHSNFSSNNAGPSAKPKFCSLMLVSSSSLITFWGCSTGFWGWVIPSEFSWTSLEFTWEETSTGSVNRVA